MHARSFISALVALALSGPIAFAKDEPKAPPVPPYEGTGDLKIDKPEDKEDVKPEPAPEGAIVLFNGKDLSNWTAENGKDPAKWDIVDGVLQGKPGANNIMTVHQFDGPYKLHVEFRVPYEPKNTSQGRGNSGVYVNSHWEVQVLDSYHNPTYAMGACGDIYTIEAASQNVAKAPTIWQSYDIVYTPPYCVAGTPVNRPKLTVIWNGVKVHDNTQLTKDSTTAGHGGDICKPGPLMLQDHGHPVQFRNIWAVPLE